MMLKLSDYTVTSIYSYKKEVPLMYQTSTLIHKRSNSTLCKGPKPALQSVMTPTGT